MLDAVRTLRPRIVIIENVTALLVRGFDRVLAGLAKAGYDAEWNCIRASDYGLPHKRERLFVAAYPHGKRRKIFLLQSRELEKKPFEKEAFGESAFCKTDLHSPDFWKEYSGDFTILRKNDGLACWMDAIRGIGNALVPDIARDIVLNFVENER